MALAFRRTSTDAGRLHCAAQFAMADVDRCEHRRTVVRVDAFSSASCQICIDLQCERKTLLISLASINDVYIDVAPSDRSSNHHSRTMRQPTSEYAVG